MKKRGIQLFFLSSTLLLLASCGGEKVKKATDNTERAETEIAKKIEKEPEVKPVIKTVGKDVYPDIDKVLDSTHWKQEDQVIKRFEAFQKKYQIQPDLKQEDIKKVATKAEVPLGILVGDWGDGQGDIKSLRIDLSQSDKDQAALSAIFFGKDGKTYQAFHLLDKEETSFKIDDGVMFNTTEVENAFKLTLKDGKLIFTKNNNFGLVDLGDNVELPFKGLNNQATEMKDIDSILNGVKNNHIKNVVALEAYDQAHLGYLYVSSRVMIGMNDTNEPFYEFNNYDILSYEINSEKQIAKFLVHEGENYFVSYIYRTPLNNYEIVKINGFKKVDEVMAEGFYPNEITTADSRDKDQYDSLFLDKGTTYIYGQEPISPLPKVSDFDQSEINGKVASVFYEESGYTENRFQRAVHRARPTDDLYEGVIYESPLFSKQTHVIIEYTLDESGNITTKNDSVISGKNIFDYESLYSPVVTTTEDAMNILKSREWFGDELTSGPRRLTITDDTYFVRNPQLDSEVSSIESVDLTSPDHLVIKGIGLGNSETEYRIFFYSPESFAVARSFGGGYQVNISGDEDKLEFFRAVE